MPQRLWLPRVMGAMLCLPAFQGCQDASPLSVPITLNRTPQKATSGAPESSKGNPAVTNGAGTAMTTHGEKPLVPGTDAQKTLAPVAITPQIAPEKNITTSDLVGLDPASLVGMDAASLVGMDAASLVGLDPASLVGLDPASLVGLDPASLVGMDAASLVGMDAASALSLEREAEDLNFLAADFGGMFYRLSALEPTRGKANNKDGNPSEGGSPPGSNNRPTVPAPDADNIANESQNNPSNGAPPPGIVKESPVASIVAAPDAEASRSQRQGPSTGNGTQNRETAPVNTQLAPDVAQQAKKKEEEGPPGAQKRAEKRPDVAAAVRASAQNSPWVDHGDGNKTQTISISKKNDGGAGSSGERKIERTLRASDDVLLRTVASFQQTLPRGGRQAMEYTRRLETNGNYTTTFSSVIINAAGQIRLVEWKKTITPEGGVNGKGSIVVKRGTTSKVIPLRIGGDENAQTITAEDAGVKSEVIMPAEGAPVANVTSSNGQTNTLPITAAEDGTIAPSDFIVRPENETPQAS